MRTRLSIAVFVVATDEVHRAGGSRHVLRWGAAEWRQKLSTF